MTSLSLFTFMHWRRKWQPTPVFLPGESKGWGHTESDTTEVTQQQQHMLYMCGFPQWFRWHRICLQCRRPRFSPWVGKTPWRKEWQPTPIFMPGESHGQRSLVGYRSLYMLLIHAICYTYIYIIYYYIYSMCAKSL